MNNGGASSLLEGDEIPNLEKLVETLKTHKGSIQMQLYIKKTSVKSLNKIIEIIKGDFAELMMDSYANYFC